MKKVNNQKGSIGYVLNHHIQELNSITTNADLEKFVRTTVASEIDSRFQPDLDTMLKTFKIQNSFTRNYRYAYNFLLAGDGLKVY